MVAPWTLTWPLAAAQAGCLQGPRWQLSLPHFILSYSLDTLHFYFIWSFTCCLTDFFMQPVLNEHPLHENHGKRTFVTEYLICNRGLGSPLFSYHFWSLPDLEGTFNFYTILNLGTRSTAHISPHKSFCDLTEDGQKEPCNQNDHSLAEFTCRKQQRPQGKIRWEAVTEL